MFKYIQLLRLQITLSSTLSREVVFRYNLIIKKIKIGTNKHDYKKK